MAKSTKIVYVTQAQYDSLINDGSVTIYGVTYTYDANNTYLVREEGLEGANVQSTGETSGKVLTSDGSGGAAWVTNTGGAEAVQAPSTLVSGNIVIGTTGGDRNVATLASGTSGYVLTQGVGAPTWAAPSLEGTSVKSTGETSGKVLTADGSGGAAWAAAGGSGDVTASGTLSVGAVIAGLGGKTVTALNGSNGKILGWSGGAVWQDPPKVYVHNLIIEAQDESQNLYSFSDHVYSTQSTALVTDTNSFVEYVKKTADIFNESPGTTIYGKSILIIINNPAKIDIQIAIANGVAMVYLVRSELGINSSQKVVWSRISTGALTTLTATDNISEV